MFAEVGGAGDRQERRIMVAAAEAGDAGDWQVKEELQAEEEEVNELKDPFAGFVTYAPLDVRTGTKFNERTGNKLSPLVVHKSGQFGIEENYKTANSWRSPRTDPPTELQF